MDNIETLKQKIEALEIQITDERIKHKNELEKIVLVKVPQEI